MDWLNAFFIPLFQVIFIFAFVLGIGGALGWGLYKNWRKTWKFKLKYDILRRKIDEGDLKWLNRVKDLWGRHEIQMKLYLAGQNQERVFELLYLYDRIMRRAKNG